MRVFGCFILVLVCLSQAGCVDPFEPEVPFYDNNLVVEGRILEGKQPAIVRLSRSFALTEQAPVKLRNAQVGIRDDAGGEIMLVEIEPGVYQSDTSVYEGVPGQSYQLFFDLEGELYESSWMQMQQGADIQAVYWQIENQRVGNDSTAGVQVYLTTTDPEQETLYYHWEYTETWEILVPFPAIGVWNRQTNRPDYYTPEMIPERCWRMDTSTQIIIATTEGLSEDRIVDLPFHYVSTQGNELRHKYSLLIKQYSISEETYRFYQQLKATTEELGTLFDPIPTEVVGNVRNVNDPSEPVLGFFSADGYDSQRIFIDKFDLSALSVPDGFPDCLTDTLFSAPEMENYLNQGGALAWELFNFDGSLYGYLGAPIWCTDCRLSGNREEPDFWE